MSPTITLLIVMGPSGCGKTTTAQALASRLVSSQNDYIEGDRFHSSSNVDKMSNGIPLTDQDRWPWLNSICQFCTEQAWKIKQNNNNNKEMNYLILSCSALKKSYRDHLRRNIDHIDRTIFIHLRGTLDMVMERINQRQGHFMKASMVESQFRAFESPQNEPDVISVNIEQDFDTTIEQILMEIPK